jgi:hypothetical protein
MDLLTTNVKSSVNVEVNVGAEAIHPFQYIITLDHKAAKSQVFPSLLPYLPCITHAL